MQIAMLHQKENKVCQNTLKTYNTWIYDNIEDNFNIL